MRDDMIHYEDVEIGVEERFGHYPVTREEVIAYALKFDPQPFHLDDEAAAKTHFGRIAASGLHTAAMMNRSVSETSMITRGEWRSANAPPMSMTAARGTPASASTRPSWNGSSAAAAGRHRRLTARARMA